MGVRAYGLHRTVFEQLHSEPLVRPMSEEVAGVYLDDHRHVHKLLQLVFGRYVGEAFHVRYDRDYPPCAEHLHVAQNIRPPFRKRHLEKHVSRAAIE